MEKKGANSPLIYNQPSFLMQVFLRNKIGGGGGMRNQI